VSNKDGYYHASFQHVKRRRGSKRTFVAVAVAASTLTAEYYMIQRDEEFIDLDSAYFDNSMAGSWLGISFATTPSRGREGSRTTSRTAETTDTDGVARGRRGRGGRARGADAPPPRYAPGQPVVSGAASPYVRPPSPG